MKEEMVKEEEKSGRTEEREGQGQKENNGRVIGMR